MRLFDSETWQELGQSLARRRVRTLLTGAGVFWGMFMLVVMVAFGRGLQRGVLDSLSEYSSQTVWVWPERTTLAYAGHVPGRQLVMRPADLEAIEHTIAGVEGISPRNHVGVDDEAPVAVRRGPKHGAFAVTGEGPDIGRMRMMVVDQGRFISVPDIEDRRKVAFLGAQVHARLYAPGEKTIGTSIVIRGVEFVVAGVFHLSRTGDQAAQQENAIILPWTTLAQVFGPHDRFGLLAVLTSPGADTLAVEDAVKGLLRRRHRVHPDDATAFEAWNPHREAQDFEQLFASIDVLLWIVGGFTLLAGALGVGNVMLVAVRERTHEIGLRKALGATPSAVIGQIVLESVTLTFVAGYLGLVAAMGFIHGVTRFIAALPPEDRPGLLAAPEVELTSALLGLATLFVAGLVSSFMPARAAAAIEPAIALQTE